MFREAMRREDPVLFVVIDDGQGARRLRSRLPADQARGSRSKVIPVEIPIGEGAEFHGIVNLFTKKAHIYKKGVKTGEYEETDIPAEAQDAFDKYYKELIETISATDDTLLERYLEGGEISREDAIAGDEGSDEADGALPALLRLERAELRNAGRALDDRRAHAERLRDGRAARVQGRRGRRTVEIHAKDDGPFAALRSSRRRPSRTSAT